jgi:hypothetical protein
VDLDQLLGKSGSGLNFSKSGCGSSYFMIKLDPHSSFLVKMDPDPTFLVKVDPGTAFLLIVDPRADKEYVL